MAASIQASKVYFALAVDGESQCAGEGNGDERVECACSKVSHARSSSFGRLLPAEETTKMFGTVGVFGRLPGTPKITSGSSQL